MNNKSVIIWASSRNDGQTKQAVSLLNDNQCFDEICLNNIDISIFDYEYHNLNDDFFTISEALLKYQNIIFCTPVYWYSMCAQMKIFFDRMSDLITKRKPIGRALAGKNTFLLVNGTDVQMPEGFEIPFKHTSEYFDMKYQQSLYLHTGQDKDLEKETWAKIENLKNIIKKKEH